MPKPFGKIALSLSGGGVRAVGYHTGVTAYLDRRQLLADVSVLSTASGGSLVGLGYAATMKDPALGQTFQHFYDGLRQDFQDNYYFIQRLLQHIDTPHLPSPAGRRYFISAYQDALNQAFRFFDNRQFGIFAQNAPGIHLEEIIINSLDCYFGEGFRFQYGATSGTSGNHRVALPDQFVQEALLSDIMAAATDLPGAFAPMVFPDDFHWPDDVVPNSYQHNRPMCTSIQDSIEAQFPTNGGEAGTRTVTLIDDGIRDNQAISSIINWLHSMADANMLRASNLFSRLFRWEQAEGQEDKQIIASRRRTLENLGVRRRRDSVRRSFWDRLMSRRRDADMTLTERLSRMTDAESQTVIGLFLVSDSPEFRGAKPTYAINGEWRNRWGITLGVVVWIGIIAFIIGAIALLVAIFRLIFGPPILATPTFWDVLLFLTLLAVVTVAVVVTGILLWTFWKAITSVDNANGSMWRHIRRLKIRDIRNMVWLRIGSVAAVLTRIMPNRIRDLGLDMMLAEPLINEDTVVINEMDDFLKDLEPTLPAWLVPTAAMKTLATDTASMGTTFWLTDDEFLNLVANGQCTTCYNLLAQLWLRTNLYPHANGNYNDPDHQQLFDDCKADWQALQADPMALLP